MLPLAITPNGARLAQPSQLVHALEERGLAHSAGCQVLQLIEPASRETLRHNLSLQGLDAIGISGSEARLVASHTPELVQQDIEVDGIVQRVSR